MNEKSTNYVLVTELERLLKTDELTLIDARTAEEFDEEHVAGAINVPIVDLAEFAKSRSKTNDGLVVTMCGSTGRGEKAAAILDDHALENVQVLEGGLKAWKDSGLPVA